MIRFSTGLLVHVRGSRFLFSRFLTYALRHTFISCPKYLYDDLKWPCEWFLLISEIKKFYPFSFLGNSRNPDFFFGNIFFRRLMQGAILNRFWWNWYQSKDISISHIVTEPIPNILALWGLKISKKWPRCTLGSLFPNFRTPKGQNVRNRLCHYVRN